MNKFASLPPDRENSTYHHIAYHFDGKKEHGYSKKQSAKESSDKRELFMGFCERLLPIYFHQKDVFKIEVFMRRSGTNPNALPVEVLVAKLYADGYELFDIFSQDSVIGGFLKEFYASDLHDAKRARALVGRGKGASHDWLWDAQKSLEELQAYCKFLTNYHPYGDVERFFYATKRKYYDDATPAPTAPVTVATPTPQRTKQTNSIASLIPTHLQPK